MTSNSILSTIGFVIILWFGVQLWASTGCEAQQAANKQAFDETWAEVQEHEKFGDIVERMEYQREWIVVYVRPSASTLPEDKGGAVIWVAQTMGDKLNAMENNRLKELNVKGNIEEEELWVIRYDFETGKTETIKSRLTQTM